LLLTNIIKIDELLIVQERKFKSSKKNIFVPKIWYKILMFENEQINVDCQCNCSC